MTGSNLFPDPSVLIWVTAYTALNAYVFQFVLIQHILSTQVSDTGPMVHWFMLSPQVQF